MGKNHPVRVRLRVQDTMEIWDQGRSSGGSIRQDVEQRPRKTGMLFASSVSLKRRGTQGKRK